MRKIAAVALIVVLAACSRGGVAETAQGARKIDCALGGAAKFASGCTVETVVDDGHKLFIVRARDGSFRRCAAVDDGRGAVPADGAEDSSAQWAGNGRLQLTVGSDRYLFPASERPDNAATP